MIFRIDQQLREKVDINNFDEYGRKLDQKISNDLNKKIDKTDLKKNNNIINKKVILNFKNIYKGLCSILYLMRIFFFET